MAVQVRAFAAFLLRCQPWHGLPSDLAGFDLPHHSSIELGHGSSASSSCFIVLRTYLKIADCCRSDINVE
jgi:hypothetical protein